YLSLRRPRPLACKLRPEREGGSARAGRRSSLQFGGDEETYHLADEVAAELEGRPSPGAV
ncbi:MAG TPA: hypothetical protein VHL52_09800, partial [Acidimicrobiia bacterium]|nr:hypothetical protein [Acidimicrobiia bacterium]